MLRRASLLGLVVCSLVFPAVLACSASDTAPASGPVEDAGADASAPARGDGGTMLDGGGPSDGTANDAAVGDAHEPVGDAADGGCTLATPKDPAFYASPTGDDVNAGTSAGAPFKTLEAARDAARASSTVKTIYLMGGTFTRTAPLELGASDSGESWLAYPGQTPVLAGQGTTTEAILVGGDAITIRWLTVQKFAHSGIAVSGAKGGTIDSNTIVDITSTDWNEACVEVYGDYPNGKITRNLCQHAGYGGVEVNAAAGTDITNLLIEGNVVLDACKTVQDCGGIYFMDRGHTQSNAIIRNNVVGDFGSHATLGRGIYLDDELSYVTVESNLVYGTGEWGLQIHGGDHDVFSSNIFDVTHLANLGLYQDDSPGEAFGMEGNVFRCNIVLTQGAAPSSLWDYVNSGVTMALPDVASNIYWSASGTMPNAGTIVDTSPTVANPDFVDAAGGNYHFKAGPPTSCTFKPIDLSAVGPTCH